MKYADNSQLYLSLNTLDQENAIGKIKDCIRDIKVWMASNYLVLNDDKTEIIHFTFRFVMTQVLPLINVGGTPVKVTSQVRDLGVVLDSNLRMNQHVTNLCRGSWQ